MDRGFPREFGVITVRDIMHYALPEGSDVVAGLNGVGREVTWATRLRAAPPAFGHISGGEIVILDPAILELIDENLTLSGAIRQLSALGISVIAVSASADAAAKAAADGASLPLIQLPRGTDLGLLERTAARSIAERRRELQSHGQEAGRKFVDLAIAGESLDALAEELASLSGRPVLIDGPDAHMLVFQPDPEETIEERRVHSLIQASQASVSGWLRTVASASSAEPPVQGWPDAHGWTRLVAPVNGRAGLLGSVSLLVPTDAERPEDTILLSRASSAVAVSLAQEQATATARREVELNVLDELLDGALRSQIALAQQAERLGHNLNQEFLAIIARVDSPQTSPSRAREGRATALEAGMRAFATSLPTADVMWRVRNVHAELVVPVRLLKSTPDLPQSLLDALQQAVVAQQMGDVVSIGIGRPADGMLGIRRSHQDARQALTLGRRIHGPGGITRYDDLGIFRLILAAENLPELRSFLDDALGELLEYDRVHTSNLVPTLEAFFRANGSPKEAASILGVHRNTVLYRLERIADITSLNLDDPDVRLRLHLALYIRIALNA